MKIKNPKTRKYLIYIGIFSVAFFTLTLITNWNRLVWPFSVFGGNDPDILLWKLEKIMEVPNDKPTIIEIEDSSTLLDQNPQFYEKAQNGDIVFIFKDRAVLFRANKMKIINITTINRLESD